MGPKPKPPRAAAADEDASFPGPGAYYHPVEYDYFSAPPAQLMTPRLPSSVLSMDDLDAAASGAVVKASEETCGTYQPPPRKQVGPAFSFGVKTRQSRVSVLLSGPGKDSPGPAAGVFFH